MSEPEDSLLKNVTPEAVAHLDQANAETLELLRQHQLTGLPYMIFLYREEEDRFGAQAAGGGVMNPVIFSQFIQAMTETFADLAQGKGFKIIA